MRQDTVILRSGPWRAMAAPGLGGALLYLDCDGYPLLRPGAREALAGGEVRRSGCFPLVPYCNRIGFGRFDYGGEAHHLERDLAGDPHSLHGIGWRTPWALREANASQCVLEITHQPEGDKSRGWPFAFTARQSFALNAHGLCVTLSLTNLHDTPAPAGLGLHPFFHRRAGERIRFVSDHAWSNGANMLPLAPVRGAPFDYGRGRILDARLVDHDFSAWRGSARFEAPDGPTVSLIADPIFRVLRLFAPPGRDFFAVEPMTHETDALNRLDRVAPMSTLAPGERLEGRVWIGLEGRA